MVDKFNYKNARGVAERIITQFGATGKFTRLGNKGGYDDDGNPIAATADIDIAGTVTSKLNYKSSEIDGEIIKKGDAYVYFHSNAAIQVGDVTTLNGLQYRAVNIEELQSVDNIVVYRKVQLRR